MSLPSCGNARQPQPRNSTSDPAAAATQLVESQKLGPMLDGYCPVTLWKSRKWIKGTSEHQAEFRGQVYHFATAEAHDEFEADPR